MYYFRYVHPPHLTVSVNIVLKCVYPSTTIAHKVVLSNGRLKTQCFSVTLSGTLALLFPYL